MELDKYLLYELLTVYMGSKKLALDEMAQFMADLQTNSNLIPNIVDYIEQQRLSEDLCPDCGNELTTESLGFHEEEAWGKEMSIEDHTLNCSNCGWNTANDN